MSYNSFLTTIAWCLGQKIKMPSSIAEYKLVAIYANQTAENSVFKNM